MKGRMSGLVSRNPVLWACTALVAAALLPMGCSRTPAGTNDGPSAKASVSTVDAAKLGDNIKAALGTVVVVNLWATWCPPCVAEMPEFARFYTEAKSGDVTFISVSANAPETIADEVKPFIEKKKLSFPVLVLSKADPEAIGKATGAEISGSLPCTLIYDRQGKLQKMLEEPITFDSLSALVKPLL